MATGRGSDAGPVRAYTALAAADPVLRGLIGVYGKPDPFHFADGGRTGDDHFAALVLHILGQQISTKVAFVLFDRLTSAIGVLPNPSGIISLGPQRLRALGLSRAKVSYVLDLAQHQLSGQLDVPKLGALADQDVLASLTSVRGLGVWTSEMFLLHQLHRPDVLPAGDMGIRRAVERAWATDTLPTIAAVRERALPWAPYRSYASALLWASLAPDPVVPTTRS
jgi:DNA-3-methyladenine glycosylase II